MLDVPLLLTDPYGHFIPGPGGLPQIVMADGTLREGNLAAPIRVNASPTNRSRKIGTGFLDDIAHFAVPGRGLVADPDSVVTPPPQPAGTYDDELLDAHFITGDGRGNENIALTAIHNVFHSEHNRLVANIDDMIHTLLTPAEIAAWEAVNPASGWVYGERLFQAARFVTEMEYSRIVIDTFARKVQPQVNGFTGYKTDIDPAITAEFMHASYRFGHSMLLETVGRTNADGSVNDIRLFDAFLNPPAYNDGGLAGPLTADQAIGSVVRGGSRQVGNEIDEFVTEALRNGLLGLPLDLPAINMMRGRSEGVAPLNEVRRQLFAATSIPALEPYPSWFEFRFGLRHPDSLVNFVAAYGTHPTVTGATTIADKRAAAAALVAQNTADASDFMFSLGAWASDLTGRTITGLDDVDLWVGGLAEKPSAFGGLLGSTNNYVFESLLEDLQDGDRLYYVARVRGMNLFSQLEQNTLAEMVIRNSNETGLPDDVFSVPKYVFNLANIGTSGAILDDPATPYNEADLLIRLPDETVRYTGIEHVVFAGTNDTNAIDRIWSSEGDDTIRGGDGVDILEGGQGNDVLIGGDGDDILNDEFGDDILQGREGNDAMACGPGFGGDIMFGGPGKDFIVGSIDPVLIFGEDGDDFIRQGDGGLEAAGNAKGQGGSDWIEAGSGLNELFGDCGAPFRVNLCEAGDDVIIGGNGEDIIVGEGGDDIAFFGSGKEVYRGLHGFDWATYKADPQRADADLNIAIFDPLELQVLRDKFKEVEALSGGPFNDILKGDDRRFAGRIFVPSVPGETCDPAPDQALLGSTFYCNELSAAGVAQIAGLAPLLGRRQLPFARGNILLGGPGSDVIEGRGGNDIIDGDKWLNVQLSAPDPDNPGAFQLVDTMLDLQADVFARRINPGDITIVRSIETAGISPDDVDTAVYCDVSTNYTITPRRNGSVTVRHNANRCLAPVDPERAANIGDGTDTLWNIERLRFRDVTILAPSFTP
jgi:Ca2+-binding RTX toxin-like protein